MSNKCDTDIYMVGLSLQVHQSFVGVHVSFISKNLDILQLFYIGINKYEDHSHQIYHTIVSYWTLLVLVIE